MNPDFVFFDGNGLMTNGQNCPIVFLTTKINMIMLKLLVLSIIAYNE